VDKSAIDAVCIYCPATDECYHVRPDAHGASVTLRMLPDSPAPARSAPLTSIEVLP